MDPRTAKRLAASKGFEMYYDTSIQLWTVSTPDLRPLDADGSTARHLSGAHLREITRAKFEEFYLS